MPYGEADAGSILGREYIRSTAMESKDLPVSLAGIMDGTDEKARSVFIVTSYNTHLRRTAWPEKIKKPGEQYPIPRVLADGSPD
jgi:hypothetical protein